MNSKTILLKAKRQVFSEMTGNNASRFKGEGYDFVELRQYQIGDDIKHIDWNITAKMQTPYVKVFQEERELNVTLVPLMSGSLYFGSKMLKQELVAHVLALLGYSAIKNQDRLTTHFVQESITQTMRPSKHPLAVHQAVQTALQTKLINHRVDYAHLDTLLMPHIKRRSLVVLIGDFFTLPDIKVLAKRHEVVAVIVRDTIEENPRAMGFASLIDPQTGQTLEGNFSAKRMKAYAHNVKLHDAKLFDTLHKSGVRFSKIYTHENPYIKLRHLFGAL